MTNNKSNIFTEIPNQIKEELFEDLLIKDNIKIERIVSHGHSTENDEWYDQDQDEWVILLQGQAVISFEGKDDIELSTGDYLNIPAHQKHMLKWTVPNEKTIWLAIHY